MNKTTALQQLKSWVISQTEPINRGALIGKINELMPKEREQIEQGYKDGGKDMFDTASDYFKSKYETHE